MSALSSRRVVDRPDVDRRSSRPGSAGSYDLGNARLRRRARWAFRRYACLYALGLAYLEGHCEGGLGPYCGGLTVWRGVGCVPRAAAAAILPGSGHARKLRAIGDLAAPRRRHPRRRRSARCDRSAQTALRSARRISQEDPGYRRKRAGFRQMATSPRHLRSARDERAMRSHPLPAGSVFRSALAARPRDFACGSSASASRASPSTRSSASAMETRRLVARSRTG